ncbi:hypothetical protein OQJ66_20035 [Aquimarina muelleri]|uniref:hypothetical protein n=1 Tax=Aquimarina muelleri TaxID=279356 RepID=UPI0022487F3F|nr:hypothetical protein [Aquimarina muelleri]MCX2765084.1 hypothetical protein [Aquimarina muelleri]
MNTEPKFKVFGESEVLKNIKINLHLTRQTNPEEEIFFTLLDKGFLSNVDTQYTFFYKIYFSYKDSSVAVLEFDNIDNKSSDYINHLYISKKNDSLYVQYIGRESQIEDKDTYKKSPMLSLKDWFQKEGVTSQEMKEFYQNMFFEYYNPKSAVYLKIK